MADQPAWKGKRVYVPNFEDNLGNVKEAKRHLGGKGLGLAEMVRDAIPVPETAVISTEECLQYYKNNKQVADGLWEEVKAAVQEIEAKSGMKFFDFESSKLSVQDILLLSIRSGAEVSMPGMMETVLNLGLNDERCRLLIENGADAKFVNDTYRRFIQMFGSVVLGIEDAKFENVLEKARESAGVKTDPELNAVQLAEVVRKYKEILSSEGKGIPGDPFEQLKMAIMAVFESSYAEKAMKYKMSTGLPPEMPTAVNLVRMVFGNIDENSASGVCFTRDAQTGENMVNVEFLVNSQGEEVVAGIRDTLHCDEKSKNFPLGQELFGELVKIARKLEFAGLDMQDIEFTIQARKLYILQKRNGKRGGKAAFKIAHELFKDGWISKDDALLRIDENHPKHVLTKQIDPNERKKHKPIAKGLAASAGAGAANFNAFTSKDVLKHLKKRPKEPVNLLRQITDPGDFEGMSAVGKSGGAILTERGALACHAAVVANGHGIPATVGCSGAKISESKNFAIIGGVKVKKNTPLTIDGGTGEVFLGKLKLNPAEPTPESLEMLGWAQERKKLKVKANADTPEQAREARKNGAEGIGLCRTEHMFEGKERNRAMQDLILAETTGQRKAALDKLLPMQRADFEGILKEMDGLPVTIRLFDPPLHEFIPKPAEIRKMKLKALATGKWGEFKRAQLLKKRAAELHEENPMMGKRGVRLGLLFPEITEMQSRAIFEAAANNKLAGLDPKPEVMVPLVGVLKEFTDSKEIIDRVAKQVMNEKKIKVEYSVGTMIEVPAAALISYELGKVADFFSFGTNDLTQMTFGYSRDDMPSVLEDWVAKGRLPHDPFKTIVDPVERLIEMSVELGRSANPDLRISICGEHGGDMKTIYKIEGIRRKFCFDAVSCTPKKIWTAIFASAQAVILAEERERLAGQQAMA